MWQGKKKAITFSFDDGGVQDADVVAILNKYGLKGTFNLNSAYLGVPWKSEFGGREINRDKVRPDELKTVYAGHEVAVHTLSHPNLTLLDEESIVCQVEYDRRILSELCGYKVCGMAYPCGGVNNDDRVADVIKRRTGVKFARTIESTHSFDLQKNLFRFNPTVYWCDYDKTLELCEKFVALETDEPQLLYIWGHSYELDFADRIDRDKFEKLCFTIAGKKDVFYATNSEALLV